MKIEIFNFVKKRWEKSDLPEIKNIEEEKLLVKSLGDMSHDYHSSLVRIIDVMSQMKDKTIKMEKD
tara:strand:+ start:177 stop:374 length:198 start_codon:yes stop_codon:yes gene_type:complete